MNFSNFNKPFINHFYFSAAFFILAFGFALQTHGQTFIEPPSAPVGGNSASWITTGSTAERKLGSLSIGALANPTPAKLCLNALDANDLTKCVANWTDVVNLSGGPFVALRKTGVALPSQPITYFSTPAANANDRGAVTIQGTGTSQAYSLIAEANDEISAAYGLFASDGGDPTNFAAYFEGKVGIEATLGVNLPGRLCLNNITNYVTGGSDGCITNWSQLVGGLMSYVRLQSTNPPATDSGSAGATKVGNFGNVVVGVAPTGQAALTFCGDGQCSVHLNENVSGNSNYCPIDCVAPLPPARLSVISPYETYIRFIIRGQSQIPTGNYYLLLVRSSNPSFLTDLKSEFIPQNGITYTAGQTINNVKIVTARTSSGSNDIYVSDTGLATDVTYYYRLYQANLFPIYNQSPLTLAAATSSECVDEPDDIPPYTICA